MASSNEARVIDLNSNPSETSPRDLVEELNRTKLEKERLNDMLMIICRNYSGLIHRQTDHQDRFLNSRKRKSDEIETSGNVTCKHSFGHSCCDDWSPNRPKELKSNVSRVHVRIDPSDTSLVVKDGYQWRKYGQKVTRDNPSPRAYYKCSLAPNCSVKKKVQRSVDDPSLLVATYEGQHNHLPARPETSVALPTAVAPSWGSSPVPTPCSGSAPSIDLTDPIIYSKVQNAIEITENTTIQQFLIEKMASSLTRDPSFTAALAEAITGRIFDDVLEENDDSISNSRVFSV